MGSSQRLVWSPSSEAGEEAASANIVGQVHVEVATVT